MIYCFSGTGNSLSAANELAEILDDEVRLMDWDTDVEDMPGNGREIGFVFPVYGWRMPRIVKDFMSRLPRWNGLTGTYVYAVLTCGDDIGRTDTLLRRALEARGWPLHAVFSVQMRNTYVCLPGFDIDTPQVAQSKRATSANHLRHYIAKKVQRHEPSHRPDIHPGSMSRLKTYVLGPLFHLFLTSDRHFHSSSALCTHCGRCVKACPLNNIRLSAEGHPVWCGRCTHCLACYHSCRRHAIGYGRFTKGKGQVEVVLPGGK